MTLGVAVLSYGTPSSLDELEAYYTHIRRGRPPSGEELDELRRRYEAIGGASGLRARTAAQLAALGIGVRGALGDDVVVISGAKHAPPFIEDAVADLLAAGATRLVSVVLAPHFSAASVGEYQVRVAAAAGGVPTAQVDRWWDLDAWVAFQAAAVREALAGLPAGAKVVFTAHSLPERVLVDDPYRDELAASAERVASAAGLERLTGWGLAWQSAGRTPEPWAGPDLVVVLDDLAATGRATGVVVCAQGFVADHLEVRYDLDIVAAEHAAARGLAFARTRMPNDDPAVMAALARRVAMTAADAFGSD